jgi:hypothetical protein
MFEHDLFPKTGTHFSGSCSSRQYLEALSMPAFEHGDQAVVRLSAIRSKEYATSRSWLRTGMTTTLAVHAGSLADLRLR